ncbi:IclR family transcriptional regulator [Halorientalis brevis]|uniref:IclR family transcriptional regulator n=1 Tax=Halorientalis brevis TaxID=1126241 RepID=A0ABD6CDL0_9EURY|nr:IclR family transcriptional regulator [Halorientalis brevis]
MASGSRQTVDRAFEIIDVLAEEGGLRGSAVADELDMPVSTAHDYLQALTATGYVTKTDNIYRTSTRFLEVGQRQRHRLDVFTAAAEELETVAEETREHVTLMIEENGQGVLIAIQEGADAVSLFAYPGARMPLHATAPGKAILAYLPPERVEEILDDHGLVAVTNRTITDREVLFDQLGSIREQGYAVDDGERIAGMVCIAAPVLDKADDVQASVCVCGPRSRIDEQRQEQIAEVVRRSANVIQVNLDYA